MRQSIAAWAALGVLAAGASALGSVLNAGQVEWGNVWGTAVPFLIWSVVSPFAVLIAVRLRDQSLLHRIGGHAAGLAVLSTASGAAIAVVCRCPVALPLATQSGTWFFVLNLLMYGGVVSAVWVTGESARIAEAERKRLEVDADVEMQRMRLVRNRIPSAFLTNVFDELERWIPVSAREAEALLLGFAESLRTMLADLSSDGGASSLQHVRMDAHHSAVRSPRWMPAGLAILTAGAVAIAGQMMVPPEGIAPLAWFYLPYASLRAGLWILPTSLLAVKARTSTHRWLAAVFAAFVASFAGETGFFAILGRMAVQGIPEPFTPAMFSMVLTSLVFPLTVTLTLILILESISVSRFRLDREAARIRSETELAAAQMDVLRSQLQPHFLFNALNSLAMLLRRDGEAALQMLGKLRDFYRSAETTSGYPVVTLTEELRLVRQYLEIEQVRFGSRLHVEIEMEGEAFRDRVPALLLQPIAENAIQHGVSRVTGPAWIRLEAARRGDRLVITFANSSRRGAAPRPGFGLGLRNTRERLERMFGDDFELVCTEPDDTSVLVRLDLPRIKDAST